MGRQIKRADDEIQREAETVLSTDARVDVAGTKVIVQKGVLHLHGFVRSVEQRTTAQRLVERMKGVIGVINQLEVLTLDRRSDVDVTADVVAALTRNELVDERKTEVTTLDGVVYLRGTAGSHAERKAADDTARSIDGVVDVINEVLVMPPEARGDEDIAAELQFELRRNLCLDERVVRVEVRRGVAHLEGAVVSLPQRWMADELARFTPGVVDVVNDLHVASAEEQATGPEDRAE